MFLYSIQCRMYIYVKHKYINMLKIHVHTNSEIVYHIIENHDMYLLYFSYIADGNPTMYIDILVYTSV